MTAKAEDGRVARGLRTREAVIDTMLELNAEGNLTPTIEQIAERIDIGESSTLKLTHDWSKGDDNRNNIGTPFCESHGLLGCNPLTVGGPNVAADSRGSTAALFNVVGGLEATAYVNQYAGMPAPDSFDKAYLTRIPEFSTEFTFSAIEFETELSDELLLNAKVSHTSRDYQHMNDNDYSHTTKPFPGVIGAAMGLPPISWQGTFGGTFNGDDYSFTELVDSDRTYEFSNAENNTIQAELTLISDYDGPFNFVAGLYSYDDRSHNSISRFLLASGIPCAQQSQQWQDQ